MKYLPVKKAQVILSYLINIKEQSRSEVTRETEQRSYEDYTFEEPDYLLKSNRNSTATPFDFLYIVIILFL